jgi:hypothetical protein
VESTIPIIIAYWQNACFAQSLIIGLPEFDGYSNREIEVNKTTGISAGYQIT